MKKLIFSSAAFMWFAFGVVSAKAAESPIKSLPDIINVFDKIAFWIATAFWIAAAIAIFYAAYIYLTASDNAEKVTKANKQLLYSVIAIAIGLMAYGFPKLILNILTPSGGAPIGP